MQKRMSHMKITRIFAFLLLAIFISDFALAKTDVSNFRISQATVQLPIITTWLDISDDQGQSISSISPEQLSITVGAEKFARTLARSAIPSCNISLSPT